MENENMVLSGLLVLVVVVLIYSMSGLYTSSSVIESNAHQNPEKILSAQVIEEKNSGLKTISSGSTGPGEVSIDLTPVSVNNSHLEVKLAANTHSVDLSQFDLKEITTLKYGGESLKPTSAPALSGHHSGGTLVFDIKGDLSDFTIKIKGIPKVEERTFEWRI